MYWIYVQFVLTAFYLEGFVFGHLESLKLQAEVFPILSVQSLQRNQYLF